MSDFLEISQKDRVLRLALDRPEKRNALNLGLCKELVATLDTADSNPDIGAILLCGKGPAFCAGMDLSEVLAPEAAALSQIHEKLFTVATRMTKPIVAAVQGAALAGGTGLVANAHIVVASDDAIFGLTEIRIGLWPFLVFRGVALAIGERRTVELSLSGRTFGAREACQWGLVHHVTALSELQARAEQIAGEMGAASPATLRSGLVFVQQIRGRTWTEAGEIGRRIREQVLRSEDFIEGIRAFREKRAPQWPSIRR